VLLVAGSALGRFVDTAAADPLAATDLAYARLLVGAELLAADFYTQSVAASNSGRVITGYLHRALANEQEHYQSVSGILTGAGQTPAVAGDIDFTYPNGTFASQGSIVKFARQLEDLLLGAYLGAIAGIQDDGLKGGLAQIAACEAQHASYFAATGGAKAFNGSFPSPLAIDQASDSLDAFTA
jgi:hypothetical protein